MSELVNLYGHTRDQLEMMFVSGKDNRLLEVGS